MNNWPEKTELFLALLVFLLGVSFTLVPLLSDILGLAIACSLQGFTYGAANVSKLLITYMITYFGFYVRESHNMCTVKSKKVYNNNNEFITTKFH